MTDLKVLYNDFVKSYKLVYPGSHSEIEKKVSNIWKSLKSGPTFITDTNKEISRLKDIAKKRKPTLDLYWVL
jgi:hypothetical protein